MDSELKKTVGVIFKWLAPLAAQNKEDFINEKRDIAKERIHSDANARGIQAHDRTFSTLNHTPDVIKSMNAARANTEIIRKANPGEAFSPGQSLATQVLAVIDLLKLAEEQAHGDQGVDSYVAEVCTKIVALSIDYDSVTPFSDSDRDAVNADVKALETRTTEAVTKRESDVALADQETAAKVSRDHKCDHGGSLEKHPRH